MNTATVVLTDEQTERLAEEERRRGIAAADLISLALDKYLDIPSGVREATVDPDGDPTLPDESGHLLASSRLWPIAAVGSGRSDISSNMEQILADEIDGRMLESAGLTPRRTHSQHQPFTPHQDQDTGDSE